GRRDDNGVHLPFPQFTEARIHVPPEGHHLQVRSHGPNLGLPPGRAGPDLGSRGQLIKWGPGPGDQNIPRALPLEETAVVDAGRKDGRHILQTVDRRLDFSGKQRLIQLRSEERRVGKESRSRWGTYYSKK